MPALFTTTCTGREAQKSGARQGRHGQRASALLVGKTARPAGEKQTCRGARNPSSNHATYMLITICLPMGTDFVVPLTSACDVSCCTSAAHCSTDCGLVTSSCVRLTFSSACRSSAWEGCLHATACFQFHSLMTRDTNCTGWRRHRSRKQRQARAGGAGAARAARPGGRTCRPQSRGSPSARTASQSPDRFPC